jgi:hypothetical protein
MVPFVVVGDGTSPIQVAMQGSVGVGGCNVYSDVQLVQSLLNPVSPDYGGPDDPLDVDGLVGPCTIGAIKDYQYANLGFADGRVDVAQETITSLVALTQGLGTLPANMAGLGPPPPPIASALAGPPSRGLSLGLSVPGRLSTWRFTSSASLSLSVGKFGISTGQLQVVEDSNPTASYNLAFGGPCVGLSAAPVGVDISSLSFWSVGTRIIKGALAPNPFNKPDQFIGPCTIISIGASAGVGISGSLIIFGAPTLALSKAFGWLYGVTAGVPNAGFSVASGVITGWS